MDIIFDTQGQDDLLTKSRLIESEDEDDLNFERTDTQPLKFFDIEEKLLKNDAQPKRIIFNSAKDVDLDEFENDMGWSSTKTKNKKTPPPNIVALKQELLQVDNIIKTSVIKSGCEQSQSVHAEHEGKRTLKAIRRKERSKTKGTGWFNMNAPELTPEVQQDLEVLRMRSVLDPKHFYKKNDLNVLPKFFQIGKVVDSPLDYYSGRLTKKERKKTIVDELMADAEFSKYNKRKYKQIIEEKQKSHYKAHKHAKKLKRKKK